MEKICYLILSILVDRCCDRWLRIGADEVGSRRGWKRLWERLPISENVKIVLLATLSTIKQIRSASCNYYHYDLSMLQPIPFRSCSNEARDVSLPSIDASSNPFQTVTSLDAPTSSAPCSRTKPVTLRKAGASALILATIASLSVIPPMLSSRRNGHFVAGLSKLSRSGSGP